MSKLAELMPVAVERWAVRALLALPHPVQRMLAGPPVRIDGLELAEELQLLLRLQHLTGNDLMAAEPAEARARLRRGSEIVTGEPIDRIELHEFGIPAGDRRIRARLYTPEDLPAGSPLLVYFHGGGWVIGDLDTHDTVCRFLARHAGVRVLSVDYRLAPEHPFPAGVDDALTAWRHAATHAASWGADPARIAIGGDSAGANLAAVVAHQTSGGDEPSPCFQLLFYPAVDAAFRRRSRDLFAEGLMLTDAEIFWFRDLYFAGQAIDSDPRVSVLRAADLTGLPPTYLATAGFDPLRDEGEEFARLLAEHGVPVVLRRHEDLVHGFANLLGVSRRCRDAAAEAAGALRVGTGLAGHAGERTGNRPDPLRDAQVDIG